ncbi:MAG: tRNA (N(6)-L-threonylcarbamoyladenosine(37)-C(2))-methylthiotransferase MtaB, partial [Desulfotomaculales bacterium]
MSIRKVAIATLGCKVNQYDSNALAGMFSRRGYRVVGFDEPADVYVINTCTVTHIGDRKSRQLIRRAARKNPAAFVVVTGCYAQVSPEEVKAIPGVDLVVGTQEKERIVDLVEENLEKKGPCGLLEGAGQAESGGLPALAEGGGRVRAFLKIQEGCSNFCTYCIVPYARGPVKSRPPGEILEEAKELLARGYREIVVTGTHAGAYGRDLAESIDLAGLLETLVELPGLARLRISSVEPQDVSPRLVSLVAGREKICRHLHIPLQSGDDAVLKKMNRRYTSGFYRALVGSIRAVVPDVAVTTDVMVGFPGETEEQFRRTCEFVREMAFSRLHVFKFSPRKTTPAAGMPGQIPAPVKEERSRLLIALGEDLARSFAARSAGRV